MLKVITRPSVFLIGQTETNGPGLGGFLRRIGAEDFHSDADHGGEEVVEVSGRGCYNSFRNPRPGGNRTYIANILDQAHGSVLEHAYYNVAICGISRILSQEITRHRHHSPSQLSQRFVDESESAFVIPACLTIDIPHPSEIAIDLDAPVLRRQDFESIAEGNAFCTWARACHQSLENYRLLAMDLEPVFNHIDARKMRRKRINESARGVLINDIETRLVLSGNARAWRWFLELRGTEPCALEMRRLAVAVFRVLQPEAPNLFQDGEVFRDEDGRESLRFAHHKV